MRKVNIKWLMVFLLLLIYWPGVVYAQEPEPPKPLPLIDWQELKTENFIIVYAVSLQQTSEVSKTSEVSVACEFCGVAEAERYAMLIEGLYRELKAVLPAKFTAPISLRLFPTEESYTAVNPLAKYIDGVTAHTLSNRTDIAIAIPRTVNLNEEQFINNIRHELAHLLANRLSNGKLDAAFQEGLAQYLEKPTADSANAPASLQLMAEQGHLLTWSQLNEANAVYANPSVTFPESLSIVAFLIDRYGLPTFLEFIKATATEPGYRSALESAYHLSADQLETDWQTYLPDYSAGRWQINAVYSYDLTRGQNMVKQGAFSDAVTELSKVVELLKTTQQTDILTQAETLLRQAQQGQQATRLAHEAHAALKNGEYDLAIKQGQAAVEAYYRIGYYVPIPTIQTTIYRAEIGQRAMERLNNGERLLGMFRFFEAEQLIYDATLQLQALDNQPAAAQGIALLNRSARQQSYLAYFLLLAGVLLLLANGAHRLINYWSANPLDVRF